MESKADIYKDDAYEYQGIDTFLDMLIPGEVNTLSMYQDEIDELIGDMSITVTELELYHLTSISGYHHYEAGVKTGEKSIHRNEVKFVLKNNTSIEIDIIPKFS